MPQGVEHRTKTEALADHTARIQAACPQVAPFELVDEDEVLLEGVFSSQELRAILAALHALQASDAWHAKADAAAAAVYELTGNEGLTQPPEEEHD